MVRTVGLVSLVLVGCGQRERLDLGNPCFTMPETLPGTIDVVMTATGGETGPVDGRCTLDPFGDLWVLQSVFVYNRDRSWFGDIDILRTLSVECSAEVGGAGDTVVVDFRETELTLPVDGETHCWEIVWPDGDRLRPAEVPTEPWRY